MKANELIKKSIDVDDLYQDIKGANDRGEYRLLISPFQYVSEVIIAQLLNDGFKVFKVKDLHVELEAWCIEW